jgi:hypothetical protein
MGQKRRTETHTGEERLGDDGGRDWSGVSIIQGTPRIASSHQKSGEGTEWIFPSASEKKQPCRQLDLGLPAFRALREKQSVTLSHLIYSPVWQPQKINIERILEGLRWGEQGPSPTMDLASSPSWALTDTGVGHLGRRQVEVWGIHGSEWGR